MSNLIRCQNGHMFSSRRYGTVCPYCNIETATKEKKETGQSDVDVEELLFLDDVQPVCGWIVCISGPRQGKDYKIKSGKNFIGRADDMDIQILGDNKISRRNHGIIVYDPKKKRNRTSARRFQRHRLPSRRRRLYAESTQPLRRH